MDNKQKNSSIKIAADFRSISNPRADIYGTREEMEQKVDSFGARKVKWFDKIACTGHVPRESFLLKAFSDERIAGKIRKAPEDSNLLVAFEHVDNARDEVNYVVSGLVVKYHASDDEVYPEYVHFIFTSIYRCSVEDWAEKRSEIIRRTAERNGGMKWSKVE